MNSVDKFGYGDKQIQQGMSIMEYEKQLETAFNSLMNKNKGDIVPINYDVDYSSLIQTTNCFSSQKEYSFIIEPNYYIAEFQFNNSMCYLVN
ncbi:hypothetical protein AB7W46_17670 [Providencia rettgeri]|uniref:hypothetical protein n=1 Tax=unclassified Providencia TaxID=2633465 RepID=UPI002275821D|nr:MULTISPECIES: hypothetical protein [unclassified Providencia]MDB9567464.1 hypothetical protein [Providencia rettgeri]WOB90788.1 hypothetical protein P3L44_19265 [Providencia sp. PROV175]